MRHVTAWIAAVVASTGTMGCAGSDEPIGEVIWRTLGGFCDGGCEQAELRRSDERLQLRTDVEGDADATYGWWTDAGLAEYPVASAEAADGATAEPPHECAPADGMDQRVTLVDGDDTFTVTFCLGSSPVEPHLERADALFEQLVGALRDCEDAEFVDVDC